MLVWEDEKALEMDSGDGCTMYLVPLHHGLKNSLKGKFYVMYISPHTKLGLHNYHQCKPKSYFCLNHSKTKQDQGVPAVAQQK